MSGFVSHKQEVLEAKNQAIAAALTEMGVLAERFVKEKISEPKPHSDGTNRPSVVTGNLRNSIDFEVDQADETVYIGTNVEYAPYVELGTSRSPEYPFLKPAIAGHISDFQEIAENHLKGG